MNEVLPEPKDYGGVTIPMIIARARGRPPEGRTMTYIIGKRCPMTYIIGKRNVKKVMKRMNQVKDK
jgi:hypothetical protein